MNTRPAIDESAGPISLSVAFNQDSSCFSVGLDTGFCGMLKIGSNQSSKAIDVLQSLIQSHASSKSLAVRRPLVDSFRCNEF